jgi:phosphatidylethanolamine/phosphatidyl-N-methylethanolamine N-methyltransferase
MSENWIFFKKWLSHPLRLGTFLPSQSHFSNKSIKTLLQKHPFSKPLHKVKVLELGAGTGRFTQSLLDAGFSNITSIEVDPDLNRFMHDRFGSKVIILNMDAAEIGQQFEEEHS